MRQSGESVVMNKMQVFAWQAYEKGQDVNLQVRPKRKMRWCGRGWWRCRARLVACGRGWWAMRPFPWSVIAVVSA